MADDPRSDADRQRGICLTTRRRAQWRVSVPLRGIAALACIVMTSALMFGTPSAQTSPQPVPRPEAGARGAATAVRKVAGITSDTDDDVANITWMPVDPKGTYLVTEDADKASEPTILELDKIGAKEGSVLKLRALGSYKAGPRFADTVSTAAAVFWGQDGPVRPGNGSDAEHVKTLPSLREQVETDIYEDFRLNHLYTTLVVPEGATEIRFSPDDTRFDDNSDPDGNFGVEYVLLKNFDLEVTKIQGSNKLVSIPDYGGANTYSVRVHFRIASDAVQPEDIEGLEGKLLLGNGDDYLVARSQTGKGMFTKEGDDRFSVLVTFNDPNPNRSPVPDGTPPAHTIRYLFEVLAAKKDGVAYAAATRTPTYRSLWKVPKSIPRYGKRDKGGDNWAARGTYIWMMENRDLITAYDDVSGEHGRNIGHVTHKLGTDVDLYFFGRSLVTPRWGTGSYRKLAALAEKALAGDQTARRRVDEFFQAQRDGLRRLSAQEEVALVIFGDGAATKVLPNHWVRDLLCKGRITDRKERVLELREEGCPEGIRYADDHNNHIHVKLDPRMLRNAP